MRLSSYSATRQSHRRRDDIWCRHPALSNVHWRQLQLIRQCKSHGRTYRHVRGVSSKRVFKGKYLFEGGSNLL